MLHALRKIVDERKGMVVPCNFLIFTTDASDNVMFVNLVYIDAYCMNDHALQFGLELVISKI